MQNGLLDRAYKATTSSVINVPHRTLHRHVQDVIGHFNVLRINQEMLDKTVWSLLQDIQNQSVASYNGIFRWKITNVAEQKGTYIIYPFACIRFLT